LLRLLTEKKLGFYAFALILTLAAFDAFTSLPSNNDVTQYYTSWEFHECYAQTWSSGACAGGVYHYYPPLTAFFGRFVSLEFLALLAVVLLLVGIYCAAGWVGAAFYYVLANTWVLTAVRGGLIPFMFINALAAFSVAYWSKLRSYQKLGLALVALATHNLAGWFFVLIAFVLELLKDARVELRVAVLALLSVAATIFTILVFSDWSLGVGEYRPVWFVVLFNAILFGVLVKNAVGGLNEVGRKSEVEKLERF